MNGAKAKLGDIFLAKPKPQDKLKIKTKIKLSEAVQTVAHHPDRRTAAGIRFLPELPDFMVNPSVVAHVFLSRGSQDRFRSPSGLLAAGA